MAKAAFAAMGYRLEVDFYPWSRTVRLAKDTQGKYLGYFPEYYSADIAEEFIFSDPMGSGPLGFVESTQNPIEWRTLLDLSGYQIGVVQDYVNTTEFDRLVAEGQLQVHPVIADLLNVKKVAAGRIDLAVIDRHVLNYLLRSDPALGKVAHKVQFNRRTLEEKLLYLCFQNTPEGAELAEIFNQGLKKIDVAAIMARHFHHQ